MTIEEIARATELFSREFSLGFLSLREAHYNALIIADALGKLRDEAESK
jgi:hypothetical protein